MLYCFNSRIKTLFPSIPVAQHIHARQKAVLKQVGPPERQQERGARREHSVVEKIFPVMRPNAEEKPNYLKERKDVLLKKHEVFRVLSVFSGIASCFATNFGTTSKG
jgi:hypothetical protein